MQFKFFHYPLAWNNWKIPLVSFWITAKSSAKHVVISCNQIQVPFRYISYSFISLLCNFPDRKAVLSLEDHASICTFQLVCMRKGFHLPELQFLFCLFLCGKRSFQIPAIEWALELVLECPPWLSRWFSTLVLHSILKKQQKCIHCFICVCFSYV